MIIKFEWDPIKAKTNVEKHHLSFETALLVFADPYAISEQDRVVDGEKRWQTIGLVNGSLLVLVAHTIKEEKDETETIRIISARKAAANERKRYEKNRMQN